MKSITKNSNKKNFVQADSEKGSALVIAILVMLLLMGFVALAISRTTTEMIISGNDASESRSFAASEASVEDTTRDLVDIFERKLAPSDNDILNVKQKTTPGFEKFSFTKDITKTSSSAPVVLTGGTFNGLYALRDSWEISSIATEINSDVKVQLKRRFFSDRVPIFQFGMFFEDDLELNRPPLFTFGGRVHTNGNLFMTADSRSGIYFNSKVTSSKQIINDVWKTGTTLLPGYDDQGKIFISDAVGNPQELKTGEASVTCQNLLGVLNININLPILDILKICNKNSNWTTQKAKFQGNLENEVPKLNLPLSKVNTDLIEIVKRSKNVGDLNNINGTITPVTDATKDSDTMVKERFSNKTGLRISLADSQAKLPGCAAGGTNCGVRLDNTIGTTSIGYQPLTMSDGYKSTAFNATRVAMSGREVWIKVEMVNFNYNSEIPQTTDITQDILSLGVTEPAPIGDNLQIVDYNSITDSRSIIKLQRFSVPGPSIPASGTITYLSNYTINGTSQNLAVRYKNVLLSPALGCLTCTAVDSFAAPVPESSALVSTSKEDAIHLKWANLNNTGNTFAIVPFPIQMFDSREGLPNDDATAAQTSFGNDRIPSAGVMSLVDIDVANLRRFLSGNFDTMFPTGTPYATAKGKTLKSTDVPNSNGWVVYFSDRRGDYDFDGEYDMEDIFPDGILQFNEDLNNNGILDTDYGREAASYETSVPRGQAASADHLYYRRAVRLINGSTIPGNYDTVAPANTKGFTFASENAVYVKGNYNVTGVGVNSTSNVTPPENYSPQNSANHIPSAIVADAVIILSNNWNDAQSFASPFSSSSRQASDTAVRFAMIAGDAITGNKSTAYSPSQFGQLNGGVHNFKRFLEDWQSTGKRLNYSGSLINLYNSHNNNGFQKCCTTVYTPPIRDWVFDTSFLNASRLPPGTPFIYSISFTGFQRVND